MSLPLATLLLRLRRSAVLPGGPGGCDRLEAALRVDVARVGFELRAPPAPLTPLDDPMWGRRLGGGASAGTGRADLDPARSSCPGPARRTSCTSSPTSAAWAREARRRGVPRVSSGRPRHRSRGRAGGPRGTSLGLDRTETKAVLDVDRFAAAVLRARREAESRRRGRRAGRRQAETGRLGASTTPRTWAPYSARRSDGPRRSTTGRCIWPAISEELPSLRRTSWRRRSDCSRKPSGFTGPVGRRTAPRTTVPRGR